MHRLLRFGFALVATAACLGVASQAFSPDSGQRAFGQATVEPAIDYSDGSAVYLLTPD
jgi:hypothetical protein